MITDSWTSTLLRRVRARNSSAERQSDDSISSGSSDEKQIVVREAQFEDFTQISEMNMRLGQGPDSPENWLRLWRDNPTIKALGAPARIGWVLQDADRIVGFLGSIPLSYEFASAPVLAAATCRFAVEPPYRVFSHLLVMAFFRQREFQLFIDSSATPAAGKIMVAVKARAIPQRDYDTILFWVLNPLRYSAYALRKIGIDRIWVAAGSYFGSLALRISSLYWNQKPSPSVKNLVVRQESLSSLGEQFETFVQSVNVRNQRIFAKRSPEILRWHFEPPQNRRPVSLLVCYQGSGMRGYLILRNYEETIDGLKRAVVADLLVERNDPSVTAALFRSALGAAQNSGADILEVTGFPVEMRDCLQEWRPYTRKLPANPFYYRAKDKTMQDHLQQESAWYACPYDGDSTLWP